MVRARIILGVALALASPLSARALDINKFTPLPRFMSACEDIRDEIRAAAKLHMPLFPHWEALMAQTFQESRCKLNAISPAGARGPLQIMPGTEGDLARRYGKFNVMGKSAIAMGARYQGAQMHQWRGRARPGVESWRLGLASYNAGLGNVLKAQKACEGRRDWRDVRLCQNEITGTANAHETITYVTRIERWAIQINPAMASAFRGPEGVKVREWFYFSETGQAPGTFWEYGGGWVTAEHVIAQQGSTAPPFTLGEPICAPGVIDACLIGVDLKAVAPPKRLREGERVIVKSVPGGSGVVSERKGRVYFRRPKARDESYSTSTTIVLIDAPKRGRFDFGPEAAKTYPVFVGQSGGVVLRSDGSPAGIVVATGGPTNLDGKPGLEQTIDVVDLVDVHGAFQ